MIHSCDECAKINGLKTKVPDPEDIRCHFCGKHPANMWSEFDLDKPPVGFYLFLGALATILFWLAFGRHL